ncbi:MAG: tetratricopeptide repeat-containing protein, partial [Blastocatellia bacterium]|nr:tetratricopeptide repeat-containing protein [Blastocatellia bacterium]
MRGAHQSLADLSTFLLLFSLVTAVPFRQAFGGVLLLQAAQQSRDAGSGGLHETDVRDLEAGKPIKRELTGGQEHSYQVRLNTGQLLKVIVEQQGIDVVAQISGPDGKQVLEFDSESRLQGQEEVSLVAEEAGTFRLTVRPNLNRAPAGSYEIRVEELRVATDTDRALHDARKEIGEALKLQRAGKYDEALPLAERALEIRERLLRAEHLDVAAAITGLASIYTNKGEYVKAEPLYRRALDIREKALGKDHPDTAKSLNNLAILSHFQGKYVEAESLFKRTLEIREKTLGKDHPDTAASLNNLAILYKAQGRYMEAESLYKRALDIWEKTLGKDHPDTAKSLNNLAVLCDDQEKYEEAESLYKRALDIWERTLGKDHPLTAYAINNLAASYRDQGKYEEAEPLFKRALDILERALGKDHPDTVKNLNNLAEVYR